MNEHEQMVKSLSKPGVEILHEMNFWKMEVLYMAVGISGEAGELLDAVKKMTIYNRTPDLTNIKEELGDLEFYMEGIRQLFGMTREEILRANMLKLSVRYAAGKYSNEQAQQRADKQQNET